MEAAKKLHPDVFIKSTPCLIARDKLIVIGSSTGGPIALEDILVKLPASNLPPIVIVQHIPEHFSKTLAERLNTKCALDVFEIDSKITLKNDSVYLGKGGMQLLLGYSAGKYFAYPSDGPRISRHCPSVDVLFRSANNIAGGKNTLAIILTGMGDDGSIGIKELHDNGAYTIAQDEKTCVVFGMPKRAIEVGAIKEVVPIHEIHNKIISFAKK